MAVHPVRKDARFYHEHSQLQHHLALTFLGHMHFQGFENVLEVGCSDGKLSAEISQLVPQGTVLGIDASEEMVDFATSHYPQSKYSNLTFQQRELAHLPFQQKFDIALSFFTLEWTSDQLNILKTTYATLKPGGRALLLLAMRDPLQEEIRTLLQEKRWKSCFHHASPLFEPHSSDHYLALLQQAHFNDHTVKEMAMNWIFPNKDEFTAWLKGWLSFPEQCSAEERWLFAEEIVIRYIESASPPVSHGNEMVIPFNVLWITAQKEKIHLTHSL